MYLVKTPAVIQRLLPWFTWRLPDQEKVLYLTFDDGPIPEITPWVLEQLGAYDAKATFFCVGDNARKHPALYQAVLEAGHGVGNHTMNHYNGWKHTVSEYLQNVQTCGRYVHSALFRPPYGRLRPAQRRALEKQYRIVMWDVLSGDFDTDLTPEACLENVLQNATTGSIVVFHDSLKAAPRLRVALPGTLKYFAERGYRFQRIEPTRL